VTVPGRLDLSATATGTATADASGFVVLTRGTDVRRIPLWGGITANLLAREPATALPRPGTYRGTTAGGASRVDAYRYPAGGDSRYGGPERVFTFRVRGPVANFGVSVRSGRVVPHVVIGRDESHLAGYTGLPFDLNPYREQYGTPRLVAGVVLPTPGEYSIVFETTPGVAPGPFSFRLWSNDTSPPRLRVLSTSGRRIVVSATDAGAGVDAVSLVATLDGKRVNPAYRAGRVTISAAPGRHRLVLSAADFQETKNMEDVVRILPNTATLTRVVTVR
jgi:hypothetical protein